MTNGMSWFHLRKVLAETDKIFSHQIIFKVTHLNQTVFCLMFAPEGNSMAYRRVKTFTSMLFFIISAVGTSASITLLLQCILTLHGYAILDS